MNIMFDDHPIKVLECLQLIIEKIQEYWVLLLRESELAWQILEKGLKNKVEDVRKTAEALVRVLGSKGYLEYGELLKELD